MVAQFANEKRLEGTVRSSRCFHPNSNKQKSRHAPCPNAYPRGVGNTWDAEFLYTRGRVRKEKVPTQEGWFRLRGIKGRAGDR
jgi:hypothetical protein